MTLWHRLQFTFFRLNEFFRYATLFQQYLLIANFTIILPLTKYVENFHLKRRSTTQLETTIALSMYTRTIYHLRRKKQFLALFERYQGMFLIQRAYDYNCTVPCSIQKLHYHALSLIRYLPVFTGICKLLNVCAALKDFMHRMMWGVGFFALTEKWYPYLSNWWICIRAIVYNCSNTDSQIWQTAINEEAHPVD